MRLESGLRIIGIVGGVASGKSAVAAQFAKLGAHLIDADKLGHQVLDEPEVVAAAQERWGDEVIGSNGRLDRSFVAERVFRQSPEGERDLAFWEGVTHPRITKELERQLEDLPSQTIVALDAAVMFKAGWDERCEQIVYVDVPRSQRLRRAIEQRGWTEAEFDLREAAQLPNDFKRQQASVVIDNSSSLDQTYAQVLRYWESFSSSKSDG